jgi:hypothetical protein
LVIGLRKSSYLIGPVPSPGARRSRLICPALVAWTLDLQSSPTYPWDGCAALGTAFGTDSHIQHPQCLQALGRMGRMGRISSGWRVCHSSSPIWSPAVKACLPQSRSFDRQSWSNLVKAKKGVASSFDSDSKSKSNGAKCLNNAGQCYKRLEKPAKRHFDSCSFVGISVN